MTRRTAALLTATLLVALTSVACGRRARRGGDWEFLGERVVNFAAERDVIPVTITDGTFKRIQLRVQDNGVFFGDLKVHFANGGVHDVPLRAFIPKGGSTRVIDLPGAARVIQKVTIIYKSNAQGAIRKGRARVRLFGKG